MFLLVDTILLVGLDFPRMDVSRILANRDIQPGTAKHNTLHSYCQTAHIIEVYEEEEE